MDKTLGLKLNWDTPINNPYESEEVGQFCGRSLEMEAIKNVLYRKDSSAMLIIGHRGVGKTSLIKKVIHELKRTENNNKTIFPVFINGPQLLEKEKKDNINSQHLLKMLITRLYKTFDYYNDKELNVLRDKTEKLYKKAAANTYKDIIDNLDRNSQSHEKIRTFELNLDIKSILKFITTGAVSTVITYFIISSYAELSPFLKLITISISTVAPWLITYQFNYKTINDSKASHEISAQEYYFFDNDIANLEFELEKLHEDFSKSNIKVIYIFDELDKVKNEVFKKLINDFKNFFNLGHAHYLFLTNEEIAKNLPKIGEPNRKEDYTYFNFDFYISRPQFKDITFFMENIILKNDKTTISDNDLNIFFDHVIFNSKCDFFDLIKTIQNHINAYNGNIPLINLSEDYFNRININSNLQKALSLVFQSKYASNHKEKWIQNEKILSSLYDFAYKLKQAPGSPQFNDFNSSEDNFLSFSAKKDLATLLTRLNYLKLVNEQDALVETHKIKLRTYAQTFDFTKEIPSQLNFLSQWEEDFISLLDQLLGLITKVLYINEILDPKKRPPEFPKSTDEINSFVTTVNSHGSGLNIEPLSKCLDTYIKLTNTSPEAFKNDFIQSMTKIVESENIKNQNALHSMLSQMLHRSIEKIKPNNQTSTINAHSRSQFHNKLDLKFLERLALQPNNIIFDSNRKKNILIINLFNNHDAFKGINSIYINEEVANEFLVIIIGQTDKKQKFFKSFSFEEENLNLKRVKEFLDEVISWYTDESDITKK